MREAAEELDRARRPAVRRLRLRPVRRPHARARPGMFDSLPYRNDAAIVLRRLVRSLPRRRGVIGVGTCDKGLPAMLMAVASFRELPGAIVPGGVTLPPRRGRGRRRRADARRALRARHGDAARRRPTSAAARAPRPAAAASSSAPRRRAQVVAEALGLTVPHAALAPSGQPIWLDVARRTAAGRARAVARRPHARRRAHARGARERDARRTRRSAARRTCCSTCPRSRTPPACRARPSTTGGGSTAPCRASSTRCPTGPTNHPTVRVFLAGGVPEVMLHLRRLGLLRRRGADGHRPDVGRACSTSGRTSERRHALRARLRERTASTPTT